mgnify:FL=1
MSKTKDHLSYRGVVYVRYADLVAALGEPNEEVVDTKNTDVEWRLRDDDGVVATIYNWKNGPNYTRHGCVESIEEWHVGGLDYKSFLLVIDRLGL